MAIIGALDKTKHFSEFNVPLQTNSGWKSPATRKAEALANLGAQSAAGLQTGVSNVRMTNQPLQGQQAPATVNTTATMTGANLLTGIITSTTAAAVAATTPTGTAMDTAVLGVYPDLQINDSLDVSVINTGANAFTWTASTGFTLVGSGTVAAGSSATFRLRRTAANTWVAYRID